MTSLKMQLGKLGKSSGVTLTKTPHHKLLNLSWSEFSSLVSIRSGGNVVPFVPYEFQTNLIESIVESKNTIILKSRQMGISETLCCYLLYRAIRETGFTAIVFSKTQQDSSDLAVRIRGMASSLGSMCPEYDSESKMELSFKGLGRIKFLPGTPRASRGIPSCSVLWFDEAAFIEGIEELYQAAAPTLSLVGDKAKVIFNSTPNGKIGLYYDLWKEGNSWNKAQLHYSLHPVYSQDPDWATKTKLERGLTDAQWSQEFELSFNESNSAVFESTLVYRAARGLLANAAQGRRYLAGLDPNFGGSDYFTFTIWDVTSTPYNLAAIYRERKQSVEKSIEACNRLLKLYRPYQVNVEVNSGGAVVLEYLDRGYYYKRVTTTNANKITNTNRLVLLLERDLLTFPNRKELVDEYLHFEASGNGKREAASGFNDDFVLSSAIAFADFTLPYSSPNKPTPVTWSH